MSSFNSLPHPREREKERNPKRSETFHELLSHSFLFINLAVIYHCLLRLSAFISFLYPFFSHNIPACQMSRKIWKMSYDYCNWKQFSLLAFPEPLYYIEKMLRRMNIKLLFARHFREHEYASKYLLLPATLSVWQIGQAYLGKIVFSSDWFLWDAWRCCCEVMSLLCGWELQEAEIDELRLRNHKY